MADLSTPTSRRQFFATLGAGAGIAVAAGGVGYKVGNSRRNVSNDIATLRLPTPAQPAPPVPNGVVLDVQGITPYITENKDLYRIDTALTVPSLSTQDWQLRVHGMVDEEFTIDFDELIGYDLQEQYITLACVSNEVGGDLIGNIKWLGYPLSELMSRAKPSSEADMVLSTSIDGYTASTPLEALTNPDLKGLLAMGMNDEPLLQEHGFPVRMVIPGLYGYVSATKWVIDMEVTRFDQKQAYWTPRGYAAKAPIKVQSRIDTPRPFTPTPAGKVAVGGIAWAQSIGIQKVEVRIDQGDWQEATLGVAQNANTWRQWFYEWDATPGLHQITCRATNERGETQPEERSRPLPDGATGWHNIQITIQG